MKNFITAFVLIFIFTSSVVVSEVNAQEDQKNMDCMGLFMDVSNDNVFCPYVEYLYHQEVVSGQNGEFLPNETITRGQVAKVIQEAFQIPIDTSGDEFPDVPSDHTFYEYIMSLKNSEVIGGYPDGEFKPDELVTRGQMMKFIINGANSNVPNTISTEHDGMALLIFNDVGFETTFFREIGSAYLPQVEDDSIRITNGYSDGTFRPDQTITRAEASKSITQAMKYGDFENVECEEYYCQDKYIELLEEAKSVDGGLFFANYSFYDSSNDVSIGFYDPHEDLIKFQKKFNSIDKIADTNALGQKSLDQRTRIHFVPNSNSVYYVTDGYPGPNFGDGPVEDNPSCFNSDTTCKTRLYEYDLINGDSKMVAEFDIESKIDGFYSAYQEHHLSLSTNSIYIFFDDGVNKFIKVYDLASGQIHDFENISELDTNQTVVSNNGLNLYQTTEDKKVIIYDLLSELYRIETYEEISDSYDSNNISFDANYIAFWSGSSFPPTDLKIYDVGNDSIIDIPSFGVQNFRLTWSNDNSKLFFIDKEGFKYYDIAKDNVKYIGKGVTSSISSSDKYLLYSTNNADLYEYNLLNLENNVISKEIDTYIDSENEILYMYGLQWL